MSGRVIDCVLNGCMGIFDSKACMFLCVCECECVRLECDHIQSRAADGADASVDDEVELESPFASFCHFFESILQTDPRHASVLIARCPTHSACSRNSMPLENGPRTNTPHRIALWDILDKTWYKARSNVDEFWTRKVPRTTTHLSHQLVCLPVWVYICGGIF